MRCSITALMLVIAPALASAFQSGHSAIHCRVSFDDAHSSTVITASRKKEILRDSQRSVESGPFYRELVATLGRPEACTLKIGGADDEYNYSARLSYVFHGEDRLKDEWDNRLDYSLESVRLPSVTKKRALELLKAAEKHSYSYYTASMGEQKQKGCGIDWTRPSREKGTVPGTTCVVYSGDICNCLAAVVYTGDQITELRLSNAC
jgi:hypothetical protein